MRALHDRETNDRRALPRTRLLDALSIGAIMLLAALVRLHELDAEPLWLDEVMSARFAGRPFAEMPTVDPGHPPLYHAFLHFWRKLDDGPWTLRLASVLFSVAAVPFVYALGRTLGGRPLATLTVLLFALAPFQVVYAQEVRMYALFVLEASVALWGLSVVLLAARGEGRARTGSSADSSFVRGAAWAAYVAGTAAMLWTQYTALLFVAAANACVLAALATGAFPARAFLPRWVAAQVAALLAWLPALPLFLRTFERVSGGFWIWPVTPARVAEVVSNTYLTTYLEPAALDLLPLALACAGAWAWRADRLRLLFCVSMIAVPLGAEIASGAVRSILLERTLIWTTIPFYALVAAGALALRPRALAALAVAAVVAVSAADLRAYYGSHRKEAWDEAAAFVAANAREGDALIIVSGWVGVAFDYYFRSSLPVRRYRIAGIPMTEHSFEQARARATSAGRAWLVRSHSRYQDPDDRLLAMLRSRCTPTESLEAYLVEVYGFENCR